MTFIQSMLGMLDAAVTQDQSSVLAALNEDTGAVEQLCRGALREVYSSIDEVAIEDLSHIFYFALR